MFSCLPDRIKNFSACILFLILLILSASWPVLAASRIMPLSQVKPGMKGTGRSVFSGNQVDSFEVEILGVMENVQPGRNWILARLKGLGLENTGVVAGMRAARFTLTASWSGPWPSATPSPRRPLPE